MGRIERDRENLLLEATALVPRVMLRLVIRGQPCEVFAGFRGDSLSVYFGASPVYHFNSGSEVRRAYVDDSLIKAEAGQLFASVRERSEHEVVLASTLLSAEKTRQIIAELEVRLAEFHDRLNSGGFELIGQVPPDGDAVTRLQAWLAAWSGPRIADVPNVS